MEEKSDYAKAVEVRARFEKVSMEMNQYVSNLLILHQYKTQFEGDRIRFVADLEWLLEIGDKYTKQQVSDEYVRSIP